MNRSATPYLLSAPAAALLACPLLLLRVSLDAPGRGHGFFTPGTWTAADFAGATKANAAP